MQAAAWYRKAAEQGVAGAQFKLGDLYRQGQGVPQDYAQAAFWWRRSAEQGNAPAQYSLGLMYQKGQGMTKDYAQAAFWWRKAAEQGDSPAQLSLGILSRYGLGVPKDWAEARFWCDLAAAGKLHPPLSELAAKHRHEAASHMKPAELARAQERVRKWFEAHQAKPQ